MLLVNGNYQNNGTQFSKPKLLQGKKLVSLDREKLVTVVNNMRKKL